MDKHWKKGLALAASVSALGIVLTGCSTSNEGNSSSGSSGNASTTHSKPLEGGNIVLSETLALSNLDPALAYDTQSDEVVQQLYDRLVTYKPGPANSDITGMLAKTWSISSDQKTYTFHLRQDAKFWNGDPVTAQSFIDEFQRVATKSLASGGESFIEDIAGEQAFFKGQAKHISGLSAPSKYTLQIRLTQPDAELMQVLTMPFFSAVDQSYINKVGNKNFDSTKAMGSGPFELTTINSNEVVLSKNPNYWLKDKYGQRLPYLNQVTIEVNNNANLDALNFEQGKTAFLGEQIGIPTTAFPHFESTPSLKKLMVHMSVNSVEYVALNNSVAPFNNKTVRRAIEYAINKKKIVKLLNGRAQVADQPLPPKLKGYETTLPADATYSYNPQKAQALLKKAGVKPGTTVTLDSSNDPDTMKIDESIQSDLKKVGINMKIKATSWATFLNETSTGKAQMFQLGWSQDYPDAGDFLWLFESSQIPGNNSWDYRNKNVDKWMAESNDTSNQTTRIQLFHKITNQVMADAPWVPLYYPVDYYAVQSWVHGWAATEDMDPLQYVWIDKGHSQS